MDLVKVLD